MRIRLLAQGVILAVLVAGGAATASPAAATTLTSVTEILAASGVSTDVSIPRSFTLSPELFDVKRSVFVASRPGSGFSLVALGRGSYPPTLVGINAPAADGGRSLLFPFGTDDLGGDAFDSRRFPAGRYRLSVFTDGPTSIRFRLPLEGGSKRIKLSEPLPTPLQVLSAPGLSLAGAVLGTTAPRLKADRYVLVQAVTATATVSATGYESHWCTYPQGPPPEGYLPRCLGGSGLGVARVGPLVDYHYSGYSAFTNVSGSTHAAFSRSFTGSGEIRDVMVEFVWIPKST